MLPVTAPFCNCSSEAIGYGSSSVSALLIVEGWVGEVGSA